MIMWAWLSLLSSGARSLDNASSGLSFGWHDTNRSALLRPVVFRFPWPLAPPLDQYLFLHSNFKFLTLIYTLHCSISSEGLHLYT